MGFESPDAGIAASIFLALYTVFLGLMTYIVIRKGFRTVYTLIFFFTLFRFGGQLCGVVCFKVGPQHWQWLISYLVLGAEGYFALIFAAFRFTCRAQEEKFGTSWVTHEGPNVGKLPVLKLFFGFGFFTRSWARMFHFVLIPANALVIAGGSMLAGMLDEQIADDPGKVNTSKALRTVGQSLFLALTICLILLNLYVFAKERVRNHTTLAVMCIAPFMMVRGIFGILSIYIQEMNYFDYGNYTDGLVNHLLVIYEYVLSTSMEFISACILMTKYWLDETNAGQKLLSEKSESDLEQTGEVKEWSTEGVSDK